MPTLVQGPGAWALAGVASPAINANAIKYLLNISSLSNGVLLAA
jgi:hypothetical protein